MNLDVWGLDKLIWSHISSPPPDYPSFIPFDIPNSFVNMGWAGDVIQVFLEEQAKPPCVEGHAPSHATE